MPYCWALRLGHAGDLCASAGQRQVEGVADDPLAALLGEQAGLDGDLLAASARDRLRPPMPAYSPSVFSRTTTQSMRLGGAVAQRARRRPGSSRTGRDADVLVEALADRQAQTPQADVVGHAGPADRAEVDRVERCKRSRARPPPSSGRVWW